MVRNEDGTYSADGEVITAETTVTAANGNVYRAVLSPEGIPVGVMHVAAMQDVMLGDLGGSVTLTQAEDMSWWYGETAVASGYVHTAANGNMYALTLDSEGMWSAMYQQVEVTVALGTQESITLARAEDMSWWLGSEAVDVASEVMSDNGNTYTLWYTDGVWSARFEPESMMIASTGLVAMTREADDMYDVGDSTLAASGVGDVTDGDAMYHVWMQDGALVGARFDKAIDTDTDHGSDDLTGNAGLPFLSANDPDTPGNELRTHLVVTGDDNAGRGMFSMGALLGSGMASDEGMRWVDKAVEEIEDVQAYVSAVLALDTPLANLPTVLEAQWTRLEKALDDIFGTTSDADPDTATVTSAVRTTAPREEDILADIADILDALSSESSFVAATAADGGGVFESQELGTDKAADAFNRLTWSADATLGVTGSTRYGTAYRKKSANATSNPERDKYGAFSYSTMNQTVRTADAAAVSLTGIATYSGGTRAVSGSGKPYSGMMDLQVRFNTNTVSGVVTGLEDADGAAWRHNFADVSQIVLGDADLRRNATWVKGRTNDATVFYTRDSGILRPVPNIMNTFAGILLGQGADAGSEANGVWSVGAPDTTGYLTGGFGVVHVGDAAQPTPSGDDGTAAAAKLTTTRDPTADTNMAMALIADGELKVTGRKFGWAGREGTTAPTYRALGADGDETKITATFDLATLAGKDGAAETVNGDKWVDSVIAILTRERDLLSTLQGLKSIDTTEAKEGAWQRVQDALQFNLFGETGQLPTKFDVLYSPSETDDTAAALESEADAIDLIDRALDALSSNAKLEAALRPDGTGVFNHYNTDDGTGDYIKYDAGQRRWEFFNGDVAGTGRTIGNFRGEREYKVIAAMGTTDFTRFGIWRREDTSSARRNDDEAPRTDQIRTHGGPGAFAYSPLDATHVGTLDNLSFPAGGSARYTGETVAYQLTTILTGTAQVDVSWMAPADVDAGTTVGTMALTISGLASAVGDPLAHGGNTTDTTGNEIADIVFGSANIRVGETGAYANNLIVGTPGEADEGNVNSYTEIAAVGRYRRADAGDDIPASGATQTVKALFVGQGVDGPLGVIGTWTLDHDEVGRIVAEGDHAVDLVGVPIVGAFGAQIP